MTTAYLIYHPPRQLTQIGNLTVYRDSFGDNEDPYLWHRQFLHTYCHITQLSNKEGQINFWVSGDTYPNFTKLLCDCVFLVKSKHFWTNSNQIYRNDPLVDNDQTFEHHYKWVNEPYKHHFLKRKKRYTLKADSEKSFQPQDNKKQLLDILSFLNQNGLTNQQLIQGMTSKKGSRPFQLPDNLGQKLYKYIVKTSTIKIYGIQLENLHP